VLKTRINEKLEQGRKAVGDSDSSLEELKAVEQEYSTLKADIDGIEQQYERNDSKTREKV